MEAHADSEGRGAVVYDRPPAHLEAPRRGFPGEGARHRFGKAEHWNCPLENEGKRYGSGKERQSNEAALCRSKVNSMALEWIRYVQTSTKPTRQKYAHNVELNDSHPELYIKSVSTNTNALNTTQADVTTNVAAPKNIRFGLSAMAPSSRGTLRRRKETAPYPSTSIQCAN